MPCIDGAQDPARWYLQRILAVMSAQSTQAIDIGPATRAEAAWIARQDQAKEEVGRAADGLSILASCLSESHPDLAGLRLRALAESVRHEPARMRPLRKAGFLSITIDCIVNAQPNVEIGLPTWYAALGALGLVADWWTTEDRIAEAAPLIVERVWRDREVAFVSPDCMDTTCAVIRALHEKVFLPRGLNLGDVCPITPALFAYLYAAAPHEMGQRLACIVFGKTSGRLPPGLNAIWRSEPATLDLVMGVVHKRLVFLTDAIDVRQAGWEDASRLARALSVGQALSSCSHGLSPNGPSPEIVGMPPAVWLDAGRLAHVLRHLVPDEMDVDDKPGLLFAVQDASRVAVTAVLVCSMANNETWLRSAIDAGLLESLAILTATRETRTGESMRDAIFNGIELVTKDPDQPLEQTLVLAGFVFNRLVQSSPTMLSELRRRLERLFRTVLTRHICTGSSTDRPMMRRLKDVWIKLATDLGVDVPTAAYHCWCKTCSDEGKVAPVKSLALCSRCRIASYASADCLKRPHSSTASTPPVWSRPESPEPVATSACVRFDESLCPGRLPDMADCVDNAQDPAVWYLHSCIRANPRLYANLDALNAGILDANKAQIAQAETEVARDADGLSVLAQCRSDPVMAPFRLLALAESVRNEPSRLPRLRDAGFVSLVINHIIQVPWTSPSIEPPWRSTVKALGLVAQWTIRRDGVDTAAPQIVDRLWTDRAKAFGSFNVLNETCSALSAIQAYALQPRKIDSNPRALALAGYLYSASPDALGQSLAVDLFGELCGRIPPDQNPVWRSEPDTLTLISDIVRKRLELLADVIDVRKATWQDATRLARTLSMASGLLGFAFNPTHKSMRLSTITMPAAVWIRAGRLAHMIRFVAPEVKHSTCEPDKRFAVQDASRAAITGALLCAAALDDQTHLSAAIDAGLLEALAMLTATRETRTVDSMRGVMPTGGRISRDPDAPLEATEAMALIVFVQITSSAPAMQAEARRRLERLFRTVLSRHLCATYTGDRPIMERLQVRWLDLASHLNVAVPTVAYHCWCKACSDEGKIAPVKSLALCSRCRIASYASADCLKRDWPQHKIECSLLATLK